MEVFAFITTIPGKKTSAQEAEEFPVIDPMIKRCHRDVMMILAGCISDWAWIDGKAFPVVAIPHSGFLR